MGAWGAGAFENDTALDWAYELDEAEGLQILEEALQSVTEAEEQPDMEEAAPALAAAETVALLRKRPASAEQLPESVAGYLERVREIPSAELVQLAMAAVEKVRKDSELRDLWEDAGAEEWMEELDALLARLRE